MAAVCAARHCFVMGTGNSGYCRDGAGRGNIDFGRDSRSERRMPMRNGREKLGEKNQKRDKTADRTPHATKRQ
jgi:hypothetical protein